MDHQDQHHEKHKHEREEEKKREKTEERKWEKSGWPIHPAWFVVVGIVAVVVAMLIWTFLVW